MAIEPRSHDYFSEQVFKDLVLDQAEIKDSEFFNCTFDRCSMVEALLDSCRIHDCLFKNCDLGLLDLSGSNLTGTRFEDSKLIGLNWTHAAVSKLSASAPLNFVRSVLNHSTFLGMDLVGVTIEECIAKETDFRESDLSDANFAGTDLSGSLFQNTNLTAADLSRARNYSIPPHENTITGAKFALPEALSLLYEMDIQLVEVIEQE